LLDFTAEFKSAKGLTLLQDNVKFFLMWSKIKSVFKRHFLAGILVLIPLVVTIWVIIWLVRWISDILRFGIIPGLIHRLVSIPEQPSWLNRILEFSLNATDFLLGLILVLIIILVVGALARTYLVRKTLQLGETILERIPLAGAIYKATRQLLSSILSGQERRFSRVVLVEYPKKDSWVLGFVSRESGEFFNQATGKKMLNIFVPTTPNPTSGFLLMVPEEQVRNLDLSVEEAFQTIISGGMAVPEEEKDLGGGKE